MECESGAGVQLGNFAVDEAAVPEALPEVPHPAGIAVEKTEPQKIAVAEISESTEVWREFVVLNLLPVRCRRIL